MGANNCSISSDDSRFLIGDLTRLNPTAQRLFELGVKCLDKVDPQAINRGVLDLLDQSSNKTGEVFTPSFVQGSSDDQKNLETESSRTLFRPLQQTTPLYHQQTFTQWKSVRDLKNIYSLCLQSQNVLYIQPIDEFPDFIHDYIFHSRGLSMDFFGLLQSFSQIFFSGYDVVVLPKVCLNTSGWHITSREHPATARPQLKSSDFFPFLQKRLPPGGAAILGIIWTDLYPEEELSFELGESSVQHKAGICSFGRFEPKGFDPSSHSDFSRVNGNLGWTMLKVISHEMCHLFGMAHCTFFHCNMNASFSLQEAMNQPLFLCPVCLRKLHQVCDFDIAQRYQSLLDFLVDLQEQLPDPHIASCLIWLRACLCYLGHEV